MERAVVRMYFEDGSFKTFLLVPTTTAKELCEQVRTKLSTNSAYYLFATPPGGEPRYIAENEKPWPLYQQHAEKCKFVFRLKGPGSAPSSAGFDLAAGFDPLGTSAAPAPGGGKVTADDFDALLGQLQFDVGGMSLGGAAAPADPFAAIDLTTSTRPPCSACGQPIVRNLLTAFGMQWHKEHLACAVCKRNFLENDVPVVEGNDGKAYCQPDYLNMFAPKCSNCTKPIQGECTNALGKQWHPACFVCKSCSKPFTGTFFEHEGDPYCEPHYYEVKNLICPSCEKPIIGKCITAKGKRYHPQHFMCNHCKKKLAGNEYFFHETKLFCKTCSITFYG